MERKHCLAWIALSMIAAALLTLLCLILNDHAETQAQKRVEQMAVRVKPAGAGLIQANAPAPSSQSSQRPQPARHAERLQQASAR
ncbi:hypothetical protein; putative exported protein [Cupriavidus phytorum]|uniref:Uncharacterized protein n=2 Tax=Cupriavidus TaxID=106589 RepID=A0A375CNA3_9BURK|nr:MULTISPECIES: hypothetical protein [Cupriavidus]PZX25985.1 hypothetical protein C7416_10755 [Cupriavidus alkaliphilus]SOY76353.1 hypothetical protein; putative exported protein [Cupriavidus taiwanensis]